MTVGKRMIILMFTQTRILTLRRRGTIMIPFRFPIRYGHIRKQRKKRRYSRFLLTDFSLENLLPENFVESLRSMTGTADQKTEKRENGADEEVSLQQLYLTENFALPFYFGYRQKFPFEVQKETYSEHEAKEKASQNYQKFHRNLSEKGLQISENHVTIELNDTSCITKGTLRVIERAVEAQPCENAEDVGWKGNNGR